eukprot:scaffold103809_cov19-Tisochrysis_lutea.AAC.2
MVITRPVRHMASSTNFNMPDTSQPSTTPCIGSRKGALTTVMSPWHSASSATLALSIEQGV